MANLATSSLYHGGSDMICRRSGLGVISTVTMVFIFTLAYAATVAPDEDVLIEHPNVFTQKKHGPARFSHVRHGELKCRDCHHEFKDGKNIWQEGQEVRRCAVCHKFETEEEVPSLERAVHASCLRCHKEMAKEGKKTGPTVCILCHPRKQAAPEAK